MYLKREKEFQHHPGIDKIIEDVTGGGTISRAELVKATFKGVPLDELPPIVMVSKDANGLYHALKTAAVFAAAAGSDTTIKVKKNHLFVVGDFVTAGGDLKKASEVITAIDKTPEDHDVITLEAAIGAAAKDSVLVQAKEKKSAGSAALPYDSELVLTMSKVDLTVANQQVGLLVRGTVNESCMPFSVDAGLKAKMPFIRFV